MSVVLMLRKQGNQKFKANLSRIVSARQPWTRRGFLSKKKRKGRERKEWITLSERAVRHCAGDVCGLMSYIPTIQ